ncbi:hypothetical protein SAMN05421858_4827 [Haladaptatus litoreus]|uniref:Uncharacterized protein n=1 Tax=Haladaptatus litoreus TaxID=553468 RepID=A0A1N7F8X4_9EURY|nr:hypothetical protein [Haladaptatus litoreus]SIR96754.1 hypothetical protein SAMN05421858_4827 [Haladaptatus litoreus]
MSTDQHSIVPKPLNPRNAGTLVQQLSPGDRVRITTTDLPRTILTVQETHPLTSRAPQLVLTAPPVTTTAQDEVHQATYHCTANRSGSSMNVIEYIHTVRDTTTRCIGTLTTIAHLPRLSTPVDDRTAKAEVSANE